MSLGDFGKDLEPGLWVGLEGRGVRNWKSRANPNGGSMGKCEHGVFRGGREPFWLTSGRWWQQWEIHWRMV